jgi:hypothetical protein
MALRVLKRKQARKSNRKVCIKVWGFEKVVNKRNTFKFKSLAINSEQDNETFLVTSEIVSSLKSVCFLVVQ